MGGCLFLNTYLKYKDHNLLSTHINQLVLVCIFLTAPSPPLLSPPRKNIPNSMKVKMKVIIVFPPKQAKFQNVTLEW